MMMQDSPSHFAKDHSGTSPEDVSSGFVDIHCHCLPDLDDGPASMEEAAALCSALAEDGISLVVATPHQLTRYETRTRAHAIRRVVGDLNRKLAEEGIEVTVLPGGEVRLDERIGTLLAHDEILTLADRGRHVLLELPPDVFVDIEPLLLQMRSQGVDLVIAHPERNTPLIGHPQILQRWLNYGASLQVTAASLAGYFGSAAERVAWDMILGGWATIVATDAHDTGPNGPCMKIAAKLLVDALGPGVARRLCWENPLRIIGGAEPLPVRSLGRQEVG
jgi:protein-tyrosine phosphatase